MLVDDGVPNRCHRENLFNNDYRVCGISKGTHKDFECMTVVEFAGSFIKIGNEDPILKMADEFLNEEVEFDDMPEDVRSWKQNA